MKIKFPHSPSPVPSRLSDSDTPFARAAAGDGANREIPNGGSLIIVINVQYAGLQA